MTIDANTIISTIVLALSAWTLRTVHEVAKHNAAADERDKSQERELAEVRARIIAAEAKVAAVEIEVAAIKARAAA